jgi:hypothetical protein
MAIFSKEAILNAKSDREAGDMISANMADDNLWLLRGIIRIFQNQTAHEQQTEATQVDNGIGFNGADGHILTSFAKQIFKHNRTPVHLRDYAEPLSERQLFIARARMSKYGHQLAKMVRHQPVAETVQSLELAGV